MKKRGAYPFQCEHGELHVHCCEPELISSEDKKRLIELGFEVEIEGEWNEDSEEENEESRIYSYKYGSC